MWYWLALCGVIGGNGVMVAARAWNLGLLWNSVSGGIGALALGWAMPGWPVWVLLPASVGTGAAVAAVLGAANELRFRG